MDDVGALQKLIGDKSTVKTYIGTFVSFDGNTVTVDVGGGRVPVQSATAYRPQINEAVVVWSIDGRFFLVGPAVNPPAKGKVLSVASNLVVLDTDIGQVTATYSYGTTLSAGQVVKIFWSDGPHVISALSTNPASPVAPPAPSPVIPQTHVDTFTPIDAGSWTSGRGWWQPQVWGSDTTIGAWFYGTKISDTLQLASVSKIEIFISVAQIYGSNPNFGTHPYASKPAGTPSIATPTALPVASGAWLTLPLSFGTSLATAAGGIGVAHGGYNKFRSLAEDPQSGALRITSTY